MAGHGSELQNQRQALDDSPGFGRSGKRITGPRSPPSQRRGAESGGHSAQQAARAAKRGLLVHCQVEGCGRDLADEKDYYRRYKVCQAHASDPCVIVRGLQQRFCQQCGTFHGVAEFDADKRSCRHALSLHNIKRRKRPPDSQQQSAGGSGGGGSLGGQKARRNSYDRVTLSGTATPPTPSHPTGAAAEAAGRFGDGAAHPGRLEATLQADAVRLDAASRFEAAAAALRRGDGLPGLLPPACIGSRLASGGGSSEGLPPGAGWRPSLQGSFERSSGSGSGSDRGAGLAAAAGFSGNGGSLGGAGGSVSVDFPPGAAAHLFRSASDDPNAAAKEAHIRTAAAAAAAAGLLPPGSFGAAFGAAGKPSYIPGRLMTSSAPHVVMQQLAAESAAAAAGQQQQQQQAAAAAAMQRAMAMAAASAAQQGKLPSLPTAHRFRAPAALSAPLALPQRDQTAAGSSGGPTTSAALQLQPPASATAAAAQQLGRPSSPMQLTEDEKELVRAYRAHRAQHAGRHLSQVAASLQLLPGGGGNSAEQPPSARSSAAAADPARGSAFQPYGGAGASASRTPPPEGLPASAAAAAASTAAPPPLWPPSLDALQLSLQRSSAAAVQQQQQFQRASLDGAAASHAARDAAASAPLSLTSLSAPTSSELWQAAVRAQAERDSQAAAAKHESRGGGSEPQPAERGGGSPARL